MHLREFISNLDDYNKLCDSWSELISYYRECTGASPSIPKDPLDCAIRALGRAARDIKASETWDDDMKKAA